MNWSEAAAPTLEDFTDLAEAAVAALPLQFREAAARVLVTVEDLADDDTLDDLGIDEPFDLTGLYDGTPLTQVNISDPPRDPPRIWLYRLPILAEWSDRGDVTLGQIITHVMVHELAHHFGWSDDDIALIDPWWE